MDEDALFNYGRFRQQLIRQLQLGQSEPADIAGLLDPVIQDVTQGFLASVRSKDESLAQSERHQSTARLVNESPPIG